MVIPQVGTCSALFHYPIGYWKMVYSNALDVPLSNTLRPALAAPATAGAAQTGGDFFLGSFPAKFCPFFENLGFF